MTIGILYALLAGLLWGLVFIVPVLLPEYSGAMLSVARYLAFGIIALVIATRSKAQLQQLQKADWIEAAKLSLIGNLLYYGTLSAAIQLSDPPLPTMIIGALPVVIAICANFKDASLPWKRLAVPLLVIAIGIGAVNHEELARLQANGNLDIRKHLLGAMLALAAMLCWTWYPIRNSQWLRTHPSHSSSTWATAQGLMTLPLALIGYVLLLGWQFGHGKNLDTTLFFGQQPAKFIALMLALGLLASWLGTLLWNKASQLLPTALAGQLIVFETLAALLYTYLWRGSAPGLITILGIALLITGVTLGVRAFYGRPTE